MLSRDESRVRRVELCLVEVGERRTYAETADGGDQEAFEKAGVANDPRYANEEDDAEYVLNAG